jgi:hypothetical protein
MSLSPPAPAPPAIDLRRPEEPAGRALNTLVARKAVASTRHLGAALAGADQRLLDALPAHPQRPPRHLR